MFICRQKIIFILFAFLEILQILQTCYFWYFGQACLRTLKVILSPCRKLLHFLQAKNQLHPPCLSGDIVKYVNFLFWILWAYLATHTQNHNKTCIKLWCFSACQKWTLSFTSSLRYYILKNPAIWLANSVSTHNLRTRILPHIG